jgi:poly(3-hydroxyalkanoate) synthetase
MSKVIYDSPTIQVIEHRAGDQGVLIGPPDAGHGDAIVDYQPGKSIVNEALENTEGGVHHIRWKPATFATRNTSIEDKVDDTLIAMMVSGSRNLIGLCQAGWLFALVATENPEDVTSLTIAGTPIDTSLGESILAPALKKPFLLYQTIVAMNGGLMSGSIMLACWKSSNIEMHYADRYLFPTKDTEPFYDWYDRHQNLAGKWYLQIIKALFLDNTFKDQLKIQCPVIIATGTRDDITPPEQSWALANYCSGPVEYFECNAGHLGTFLSGEAQPMWGDIFSFIRDMSNANGHG